MVYVDFRVLKCPLETRCTTRFSSELQGRVDPSDVLQEAYIDLARRLPEYAEDRSFPFFLWLRLVTGQRLMHVHRRHLQTAMRDATQEVSLYRGAMPQATSMSLANLIGRMTSVSEKAVRAEMQTLDATQTELALLHRCSAVHELFDKHAEWGSADDERWSSALGNLWIGTEGAMYTFGHGDTTVAMLPEGKYKDMVPPPHRDGWRF